MNFFTTFTKLVSGSYAVPDEFRPMFSHICLFYLSTVFLLSMLKYTISLLSQGLRIFHPLHAPPISNSFIWLNVITFTEEYQSQNSSFCSSLYLPSTFLLLNINNILSTLFQNFFHLLYVPRVIIILLLYKNVIFFMYCNSHYRIKFSNNSLCNGLLFDEENKRPETGSSLVCLQWKLRFLQAEISEFNSCHGYCFSLRPMAQCDIGECPAFIENIPGALRKQEFPGSEADNTGPSTVQNPDRLSIPPHVFMVQRLIVSTDTILNFTFSL
jgi:hypothetical protein